MATGVTEGGHEVAWSEGIKEAAPSGDLEKTPEHIALIVAKRWRLLRRRLMARED